MGRNVTQKLIEAHLVAGEMVPGTEVGLRIDQSLTQDATGTMVMLELEALGLEQVRSGVSVQYVDHNLLQTDERNMADHLFLRSACQRFGLWYSKPGNGVSHPTHMQRFGVPGATLVGSDSHTCAAGSLGMLAIGVGGLDVALAMAGEPLYVTMPQVWGIRLTGVLPAWVSAKDVILELLRRHGVTGAVHRIIEYHGPGLAGLSAMDRHVIANMGAELGATTTVFPADERVREFLVAQDREDDFLEILADPDAGYDVADTVDLSALEPLIAAPSSPGNVTPVRQVAGTPVQQVVLGSSANPGLRDFAMVAAILRGRQTDPQVSLDINPTSRQLLADLTTIGATGDLIRAGARLHQAGCNPQRARQTGQHLIVAGANYGQGSSREHAAIAPRHLGLRVVIAKSYARIHWQNLANFGILPLQFTDDADYERITAGDVLALDDLRAAVRDGTDITVRNQTSNVTYRARHRLSPRQTAMILAGGQIPRLQQPQPPGPGRETRS